MGMYKILGIILFLLLTLPFTGLQARELEGGKIYYEGDPNEIAKELLKIFPPSNPFAGEKVKDMESVAPFSMSPFSEFDISLSKDSKKTYNKNEQLSIKGTLTYRSQTEERIDRVVSECLEGHEGMTEEEKKELCSKPAIYTIPYFKDVGVFVYIWREDKSDNRVKNGDYLIDEFYVLEGADMKESDSVPFELKWTVPEGLEEGNYYASFSISSQKKFVLKSSPLSIYSPIYRFDFNVRGEGNGVGIDKNGIKVNGEPYFQVLPVPSVEAKEGKINIVAPIVNNSGTEKEVKVKYELYKWIHKNPYDLVTSKQESYVVKPGNSIDASFDFSPDELSGFYRIGIESIADNNKSRVNVFLVVKNGNRGIFTYLGMAEEKTGNKLFPMFCIRNAQLIGFFKGRVEIKLFEDNKKKGSWSKIGIMEAKDGKCFIVKEPKFKGVNKDDCLKIQGRIFSEYPKLADKVEVVYNCQLDKKDSSGFQKLFYKLILVLGISGVLAYLIIKFKKG